MQSLGGKIRFVFRKTIGDLRSAGLEANSFIESRILRNSSNPLSRSNYLLYPSSPFLSNRSFGTKTSSHTLSESDGVSLLVPSYRGLRSGLNQYTPMAFASATRSMNATGIASQDASSSNDVPQRVKFKRMDKTARHIMQILDKEAVEDVKASRDIPDIRPGYIVQLKVEVPENKRRSSIIKGIVIARRNAGLNTTFRIRRIVTGVGIESLFHLYSPNLKEIKVLDKKKVRRAKLYYLRDKMNALKKQ